MRDLFYLWKSIYNFILMVINHKNIVSEKRFWIDKPLGRTAKLAPFFMGYFEISAPQERSKSNRVLFNMELKFRATDNLRTRPVIARATLHACLDWDK